MNQPSDRLPPRFWSAPAVAAALATCDVAALIGEIRRERGWTQTELAEVIGYSQSWVSKVLRGRQPLTVDQVREVAGRLGIPLHLLRFGERPGERAGERPGEQAGEWLDERPGERVVVRVDETTALTLTSITGARRRLEAATPSRKLVRGAVAHVDLAGRVLRRIDHRLADEVRAGLSEAAGFAAWIHGDMLDRGTARVYYRLAVDSARQAGHRLLAAYMLGSRAAFEVEADEPELALTLLARARRELGGDPPHTARAWLSSIEAIGHAAGRDADAAHSALRVAEAAVTRGERAVTPPWPWVFPFDHAKLAGYRAVVSVRLGRAGEAERAFSESLAASSPAAKQHGVLMTEMATAKAMAGRHDEAFDLAADALSLGVAYGSDRVIQRARTFRRAYAGPVTATVRTFDERLHATML
ncbi:helix-turn-helix transcriptional regulator [Nonomuraea muscovyensis]|uniref:helix-turn-helix domain-containing protein n=1 Tax=Nonomuraea muscovyensis TaxID=1124761 RepID=UPI0033D07B64